jgi:hypothetical protein
MIPNYTNRCRLIRLTRLCHCHLTNGRMPLHMAASFRRHPQHLRDLVDTMIAWNPERAILAHGRWYPTNGTAELSRAFCWIE